MKQLAERDQERRADLDELAKAMATADKEHADWQESDQKEIRHL